jgi:hypothetical protein
VPTGNGKSVWSALLVAWTLAFTAMYPAAESASIHEACPAGDDSCLDLGATGRASEGTDGPAHADFNGDGISDLAIGVALEDVGGVADAGAINVLYGTRKGLSAGGNQFITQDSAFMNDAAEAGDQFGRYNGTGDFNSDGFADLAIGVPLEDVGDILHAGAVNVMYGSVTGLTHVGNQFITQSGLNPQDDAEELDWFGGRIQGGDFNGDGYDDLAVGTYLEDVAPGERGGEQLQNAGAVNVLYGSGRGLLGRGSQFWTQDSPGVLEDADTGDVFGRALAAGDLNADGFEDLAVSARGEDIGQAKDAGAVNVLYGSVAGLTATGNELWTQDRPGILDQAEEGDWLGRTGLASGDFNEDGYSDLGIGALQEAIGEIAKAGAVNVIYGSAAGLTAEGNQFWTQDSPGIAGDGSEGQDRFGRCLVAADFNGDGFDELAIGISQEDVGAIGVAGAIILLHGSAGGLTADGSQFWHQDTPGILDQAEDQDSFAGRIPGSGDLNGDGYDDLTVGVFKEDLPTVPDAGGVNVIYGSAGGLTAEGDQFWTQDSPGVRDAAEETDTFGQDNVG